MRGVVREGGERGVGVAASSTYVPTMATCISASSPARKSRRSNDELVGAVKVVEDEEHRLRRRRVAQRGRDVDEEAEALASRTRPGSRSGSSVAEGLQRLRPRPVRGRTRRASSCVPRARARPPSFARLASSSASRVLPTPLSPLTRKSRPRPAAASSSAARELVELAVASDEDAGGAAAGPRRRPRAGEVERGVLAQDRLLELLQPLARLDPELVDERAPRVAVRLRAPRPGGRSGTARASADRAGARAADGARRAPRARRTSCVVRAEREVGVDARPRARRAWSSSSRASSARANGSAAKSASGAPRQSASASTSAARAPAASRRREQAASLGRKLLEPRQVEVARVGGERGSRPAASARRLPARARGAAARRGSAAPSPRRRGARRPTAPRSAAGRVDDLVRVQEQDREQGALLAAGERDRAVDALDLERAQDAELHAPATLAVA